MDRVLVVAVPGLNEKHRRAISQAARQHDFIVRFYDSPAEALPHLDDAEVILGQSASLARNAPRLKWLCSPSAGVDHFLRPGTFLSKDAVLSNSSGAYGVTIAEHIVMWVLEMQRRQMEYNAIVARREWKRDLEIGSIHGSRITLAGTGDIGCEAAVRLRAFSPKSLTGINRSGQNPKGLFDRIVKSDETDSVLPGTDILILSLPGTDETCRFMDAKRLSLLPDGVLLVNVGRGSAVDQSALEKELRSGRLRAALDVFESEPLPPDDSLWTCPNLLLAPHVAGNMTLPYTRDRIVALFLEDFDNYCSSRPLIRKVDPEKGY